MMAAFSLLVWAGAIVSGRLLAYTCKHLLGDIKMLDETLREFARWLSTTALADFMTGQWEWPIAESLHFIGLSMLIGTIGVFDLAAAGPR